MKGSSNFKKVSPKEYAMARDSLHIINKTPNPKSIEERLEKGFNIDTELALIEDENGGYTAFFKEIPKVLSEGETKEKAYHNLILALHDIVEFASRKMI